MHFCPYSVQYRMMHYNLQMFAFNFSSLHVFPEAVQHGQTLCVDTAWVKELLALPHICSSKTKKSWSDMNICLLHHCSLTSLLYWSFQEISCWHAERSVSQPLTISLHFTQTYHIIDNILNRLLVKMPNTFHNIFPSSLHCKSKIFDIFCSLQMAVYASEIDRNAWHQVFQYVTFDLGQNKVEFISSNAEAWVGLVMCCEGCVGEGRSQEVKTES